MIDISKQRLKYLAKLKHKKYRESERLVLVEGSRTIKQIIDDGVPVEEVICCPDVTSENRTILSAVKPGKQFSVSESNLKEISATVSPQKIFALVAAKARQVERFDRLIFLDRISDPSNMGTIFRTASAFDYDGIILSEDCSELFNPKTIRSSVGKVFTVPVLYDFDLASFNGEIILADVKGNTPIEKLHVSGSHIIILGSEASGVRKEISDLATQKVSISMKNRLESLNVAAAAAILMYRLSMEG